MMFKKKDGKSFEFGGIKGVAVTTKDNIESGSVAYIEVNGKHGKMKNTGSDRFYFIIEGSGKFIIKDEEFQVEEHDVVIIPKDTDYDYEGNMKVVLFSTPAFNPKDDVYYDE